MIISPIHISLFLEQKYLSLIRAALIRDGSKFAYNAIQVPFSSIINYNKYDTNNLLSLFIYAFFFLLPTSTRRWFGVVRTHAHTDTYFIIFVKDKFNVLHLFESLKCRVHTLTKRATRKKCSFKKKEEKSNRNIRLLALLVSFRIRIIKPVMFLVDPSKEGSPVNGENTIFFSLCAQEKTQIFSHFVTTPFKCERAPKSMFFLSTSFSHFLRA